LADLSEVSDAIVDLLTPFLYPSGTANPSAIGAPVKIFAGWPPPGQVEQDLTAGIVTVSVYPQPSIERVTTRYPQDFDVNIPPPVSTLTATISGNTVALGGIVTVGQYITLIIGGLNGMSSSYAAQPGDTLETIAAALAQGFSSQWFGIIDSFLSRHGSLGPISSIVSDADAVITFPLPFSGFITARTGAAGQIIRELRRQQRSYQIVIWAPTPVLRTATANIVDPVLASTDFVQLPDLSQAWLVYRGSNDDDNRETVLVYRRDIFYWAEFGTTQVQPGYPITDFVTELETNNHGHPDFKPLSRGVNTPGFTFRPDLTTHSK
jgi:hypothetical protein